MERTRIAKVENVTLFRRGDQVRGTLHLTPHHLIFSYLPPLPAKRDNNGDDAASQKKRQQPRELWITYPVISYCTFRPCSAASRQPSSIRLQCRDFAFVCFYFPVESQARETYESIKSFTCKVGRVSRLYAFVHRPMAPENQYDGWGVYNSKKEWARMGVTTEPGADASKMKGWRLSSINSDYSFSPSYPNFLAVPSSISDSTILHAGKYRSRARIPVLTYLHPVNNCSITRASQPLVGVRNHRSIQDEKLLAAIFATSNNKANAPNANTTRLSGNTPPGSANQPTTYPSKSQYDLSNTEELEDEMIFAAREQEYDVDGDYADEDARDIGEDPTIYGAQQHNLIVDARPPVNAYAMQAVGLGSENMDNYRFATKAYLGIDNIHIMRDSLLKVVDALKDSDLSPLGPNRDLLTRSNWLKHISGLLDGAALIARQVGLRHSHVLIHCSDGWDRTSQLSALSQLCLDPYYRTIEGFMVLVEKDWLAFGHMFRRRSGILNSEKWFQVENDWSGGSDGNEGGGAGKAIENAFLSARGFFHRDSTSSSSTSRDHLETPLIEDETITPSASEATKPKETSPVFHQFLDATYQLLYQHPTRFQFNERFLRRLLYHVYSCQYGTFLFDSEKERQDAQASTKTRSVWEYFLARQEQFLNPAYDPTVDDTKRGCERMLFPRLEEVRWWSELFGRRDEEMNVPSQPSPSAAATSTPSHSTPAVSGTARSVSSIAPSHPRRRTSVLEGVESAGRSFRPNIVGSNASRTSKKGGRPTDTASAGAGGGDGGSGGSSANSAVSSGMAALAAGLTSLGLKGNANTNTSASTTTSTTTTANANANANTAGRKRRDSSSSMARLQKPDRTTRLVQEQEMQSGLEMKYGNVDEDDEYGDGGGGFKENETIFHNRQRQRTDRRSTSSLGEEIGLH